MGHFAKKAGGLAFEQSPEPPAQFLNPDLIKERPIRLTVGPVTIGGNIRSITAGGKKEIRISIKAHIAAVPMMAPYPSGHGRRVPSAALGQKPFSYIWAKAPEATLGNVSHHCTWIESPQFSMLTG